MSQEAINRLTGEPFTKGDASEPPVESDRLAERGFVVWVTALGRNQEKGSVWWIEKGGYIQSGPDVTSPPEVDEEDERLEPVPFSSESARRNLWYGLNSRLISQEEFDEFDRRLNEGEVVSMSRNVIDLISYRQTPNDFVGIH